MNSGSTGIRASHGHSANGGVGPDYIEKIDIDRVGWLAHGTSSIENAWSIRADRMGCVGRLHIHIGEMTMVGNGERAACVRRNSQARVLFSGAECIRGGVQFYRSDNNAIPKECINGELPSRLAVNFMMMRSGGFATHDLAGR